MADSRIQLAEDWNDDPWFRFPRAFIRDDRLSWRAKGVAALLASHSSTFQFSADELMKWAKDGRDGTRAALRELEAAGYLQRERVVDDESGRASGMLYRLFTKPQVSPQTASPSPVSPSPVAPSPVKASDPYKESTPKEYHLEEDHEEVEDSSSPDGDGALFPAFEPTHKRAPGNAEYDAEFDAWWPLVPRKVGKEKAKTEYRAARRRGVSAEHITHSMEQHAARWKVQNTEPRFIPHPATWLHQGRYDDDPLQAVPAASGGSSVAPVSDWENIDRDADRAVWEQWGKKTWE